MERRKRTKATRWSRARKTLGKALKTGLAALILLAVCAGFVIERYGGSGWVPSWRQLYAMAGLQQNAPDPALLQNAATTVTFLDVGQGDAVLISQDGEFCLIDAGPAESADVLLSELKRAGVKKLNLLVLTHPHADHIGGMQTVLNNFPVEQLVMPADAPAELVSYAATRLRQQAESCGTPVVTAAAGDAYPLGSGTLTVLFTGIAIAETSTDDAVNDTSLCLRFTAGSFAFVDTGDAEADEEAALLAGGADVRADLLKAGHHGSSTSTTQEFLDAVGPQAVGISCGKDNDYGHPHPSLLYRLRESGAEIYRTDRDGSVTIVPQPGGGLQASCTANGAENLPAA